MKRHDLRTIGMTTPCWKAGRGEERGKGWGRVVDVERVVGMGAERDRQGSV